MSNTAKRLLLFIMLTVLFVIGAAAADEAKTLDITFTCSDGDNGSRMQDADYETKSSFSAGETVTVDFAEKAQGIYIIWGDPVKEWKLTAKSAGGQTEMQAGTNGYLHEYIDLSSLESAAGGQITGVTINFLDSGSICDIYVYGEGSLPDTVQIWEPSCSPDKPADFLVFSTHSDDEILFLGGVLAVYAGQENLRVQMVYMTHYFSGPYMAPIREHEKLDGIWHSGVRQYPVTLDFEDLYCTDLESALDVYEYDDILAAVTAQIRYFKPLVVVTQDFNGEYGHGGHMILAKAVAEAVDNSSDANFKSESATAYGAYDVPKTYIHLYKGDGVTEIEMNLQQPLDAFGGKTAVEIAAEAYKFHVSQQWCWFYVSDDYEYSCDEFGLYRLGGGQTDDGSADMMNSLTSYEVKEEEERKKAEEEGGNGEDGSEASEGEGSDETQTSDGTDTGNSGDKGSSTVKSDSKEKKKSKLPLILIIILVVLVLAFVALKVYTNIQEKKRQERRRQRQRERELQRQGGARLTGSRPSGERRYPGENNTSGRNRPSDGGRPSGNNPRDRR